MYSITPSESHEGSLDTFHDDEAEAAGLPASNNDRVVGRAPRRHCCILQRSSRRTAAKGRKRYSDYDYDEDLADDGGAASGDDDGSTPRRFRNVRFTTEDRRFGACSPLQPLQYVILTDLLDGDKGA